MLSHGSCHGDGNDHKWCEWQKYKKECRWKRKHDGAGIDDVVGSLARQWKDDWNNNEEKNTNEEMNLDRNVQLPVIARRKNGAMSDKPAHVREMEIN